jgi:hypothetical protein
MMGRLPHKEEVCYKIKVQLSAIYAIWNKN